MVMPITRWVVVVLASLALKGSAWGQLESPVTVDDSPWAFQTLRMAEDMIVPNPGEASRLLQSVLDQAPLKLVPISADRPDQFVSARRRIHTLLQSHDSLLDRYRQMEGPVAEERLAKGDLEGAAQSMLLTLAGLRAQLELAQRDAEAGQFNLASTRLAEVANHPDLSDKRLRATYWTLRGITAIGLDRTADADVAVQSLQAGDDEASKSGLSLLQRMRGGFPTAREDANSLFDTTGVIESANDWHRIWSEASIGMLFDRRMRSIEDMMYTTPQDRERRRRDGELLTATGAVRGSMLYVNEGSVVRAMDRFSHRERWSAKVAPLTPDRESGSVGDLNLITLRGDALVVVMGFAFSEERSAGGLLARLDVETGDAIWRVNLAHLPGRADLSDLFPHGQPIITDNTVYVMARRVTAQMEALAYVVAIDLSTGNLRWARFISSASGRVSGSHRWYSTLTERDGDLYVSSSLGSVARLHGTNGEIAWLRRLPAPIRESREDLRPWEIGAAAVTNDSVLALSPDESRVFVFDRSTGADRASYSTGPSEVWGDVRYIFSAGETIFAVGADVCAFDADELSAPRWRLSTGLGSGVTSDRPNLGIRGRVHLATDTLLVPRSQDLVVVAADTGRVLQRIALAEPESPANPIAVGPQIIMVMSDRIESYMPFSEAESLLRARAEESPHDAERILALLHLGLQARNPKLCMDAAGLGQAAIDPGADESAAKDRADLFDALLDIHHSGLIAETSDGDRLHGLIGAMAATPEQRLIHLLTLGDWLMTRNRRAGAVETWQSILTTPALADAMLTEESITRPGAAIATERLAKAVHRMGVEIYATQSDFAARELSRMVDQHADPKRLCALAQMYPFSEAAIDAAALAVRSPSDGDERRATLGVMAQLIETQLDLPDRCARLLTLMQDHADSSGGLDLIQAMYRKVARVHPNLQVSAPGGMIPLAGSPAVQRPRWPRLGVAVNGAGRTLGGRLVSWRPDVVRPPDWFLTVDEKGLHRINTSLTPVWTTPIGHEEVEVLALNGTEAILVYNDSPVDPGVAAIDVESGVVRWQFDSSVRLLPPLAPIHRDSGRVDPLDEFVAVSRSEILPLVNSFAVLLIRRDGAGISLSRIDGHTLWQRSGLLDRVQQAAAMDLGMALAGTVLRADPETGDAEIVPTVMTLDPRTGSILRTTDASETIPGVDTTAARWLCTVEGRLIAYGADRAIEMIDVLNGSTRRFLSIAAESNNTVAAWPLGDQLLIIDALGNLHAMSAQSGEFKAQAFDPQIRGDYTSMRVRNVFSDDEGVVVHFDQKVAAFRPDGTLLGRDEFASEQRDYFEVIPVEDDRLVVANLLMQRQSPSVGGINRTTNPYLIFQLDRSQGCKIVGDDELYTPEAPPYQPMDGVQAVDGWLLVSAGDTITALPMPPGS